MARYAFNTPTSKSIKVAAKKFGIIEVNNQSMNGVIEIVNFRRYQFRDEVDIIFKGKIRVKVSNNPQWYDSETITAMGKRISKVKLNRFLRKSCIFDIKCRMKYFGSNIKEYNNIKKLIWI